MAVKGSIPWNKGKKGLQVAWNKGKPAPWAKNSPTAFKKGHPAPKTAFQKGQRTWNKGLKGTKGFPKGKHNEKISGANHYCWKGGVTPENRKLRRNLEIRLVIADSKKRDNYICQMPGCGNKGGKLESHHIKRFIDYPDLRNDITNLITLCSPCHNKTKHKEKQFEELFISIIKLKNL